MLGWVITCHDDRAQEMLDALEKKHRRTYPVPGGEFLARIKFQYAQPHDVRCSA